MYSFYQCPVSATHQFDNPYLTQLTIIEQRITEQRRQEYQRQLAQQQANRAFDNNLLLDAADLILGHFLKRYPVVSTIYEAGGAVQAAKQNRPVKFAFKTVMAAKAASRI